MLFRIALISLLFFTTASFAQKKRKEAKAKSEASSVEPYYPETNKYVPAKKKGKRGGITYNAQDNFYKQRDVVAKQKRYAEKELDKPQNTNPAYFGHKRLPKKRPPEKMKFCKVCGLRH
jgi:hypothetical protein